MVRKMTSQALVLVGAWEEAALVLFSSLVVIPSRTDNDLAEASMIL